jgi:protein KRI1
VRRLKELENEGIETESSGTEEDEEAQLLTEEMDLAIMDTIARIKKKDPRIYDSKAKFFEDFKEEEEEEGKEGVKKEKKEKKEKKFTVTDMAREMILKGKDGANSDEDEEEEGEMGYYEEQDKLKRMFKDSKEAEKEEDGSDDDLFVPRKKGRDEKIKEDREYEEFARDRLAEKNPTQTLATLLKVVLPSHSIQFNSIRLIRPLPFARHRKRA